MQYSQKLKAIQFRVYNGHLNYNEHSSVLTSCFFLVWCKMYCGGWIPTYRRFRELCCVHLQLKMNLDPEGSSTILRNNGIHHHPTRHNNPLNHEDCLHLRENLKCRILVTSFNVSEFTALKSELLDPLKFSSKLGVPVVGIIRFRTEIISIFLLYPSRQNIYN